MGPVHASHGCFSTSDSGDVAWTCPAAFTEVPALSCGPTTNAATLVGILFATAQQNQRDGDSDPLPADVSDDGLWPT